MQNQARIEYAKPFASTPSGSARTVVLKRPVGIDQVGRFETIARITPRLFPAAIFDALLDDVTLAYAELDPGDGGRPRIYPLREELYAAIAVTNGAVGLLQIPLEFARLL
jgi:hypothetical protein